MSTFLSIFIPLFLAVMTILYLLLEADAFGLRRIKNNRSRYDYYIAGPMRGYPNYNHEAFEIAAKVLRNRGYKVFSPAEVNDIGKPYAECMKIDINAIVNLCDGILLLNGWKKSLGANIETFVAFGCGKTIRELMIFENKEMKDGYELVYSEINPEHYLLPYNVF